jgi:hypothetical protein
MNTRPLVVVYVHYAGQHTLVVTPVAEAARMIGLSGEILYRNA